MSELYGGGRPFFVDGVGDAFYSGNDLRAHPELTFERKSALRNSRIGQSRHTDPAGGHRFMVVVQHVGRGVSGAHAFKCSRPYRPVSQGQRPDFTGSEQYRFFFHIYMS